MGTSKVVRTQHVDNLKLDTLEELSVTLTQVPPDGRCIFQRWPNNTNVDSFDKYGRQATAHAAQHTYASRHLADDMV